MLVTMSDKEIHRLPVIQAVCEKRLRRRDAASQLGISERQAQRLINRYRVSGAEGLVSRKRGQPSNRRLTESLKLRVLTLIRENYSDFGPTLAAEKLRERHNIRLSIETVRNWMTSDGLWVPHARRKSRVYQPRHRRDCLGEAPGHHGGEGIQFFGERNLALFPGVLFTFLRGVFCFVLTTLAFGHGSARPCQVT